MFKTARSIGEQLRPLSLVPRLIQCALYAHARCMLRVYVNRQQPFGTTDWQATTAAMLGLSSTLRTRGGSEDCQKSSLSPFILLDEQHLWKTAEI